MLLGTVLVPLVASVLVAMGGRPLGVRLGYAVALIPAGLVAFFARLLPAAAGQEALTERLDWVPQLGIELAFRLDGFSALFALLITGIGLLVVLYSIPYLGDREDLPRFYASVLLFMTAMLGVVLSTNLLGMYVFWEITSVASFLLIGYWYDRDGAIHGANKSLTITVTAGLSMLAGLILVYLIGGTYDLTVLVGRADQVVSHPLGGVALILILLGAMAKSAQVPFHIWLPDAMAAPTPISAYLHSATMVKAGLFLAGRLWPVFHAHPYWVPLVTGIGLITMVLGGYLALKHKDLKAILAMSTISQLGLITSLFGLGTDAGVEAAVFHILNHATFKACLFMIVGIIDHETGTRDLRLLGGLRKEMPCTFALALVAALAMAGAPPLNGFLSKEMAFAALVEGPGVWSRVGPVLALLGSVFTVGYSFVVGWRVFTGPLDASGLPRKPHEAPWLMLLSPAVLAALVVAVGIFPGLVEQSLVVPAASAVVGRPSTLHIAHWHGLNLPVLMSAATLAGGIVLLRLWDRAAAAAEAIRLPVHANFVYDRLMSGLEPAAKWITRKHMTGLLRDYLLFTLLVTTGVIIAAWGRAGWQIGQLDLAPVEWRDVAVAAVLVAGTVAVLTTQNRLVALTGSAAVGVAVTLFWVLFRNPDLALTQLGVEAVSGLVLLLVFARMPKYGPEPTRETRRLVDGLVATGMGVVTFLLVLLANGTRLYPSISSYFTENSVPATGGHNVVNVILVDFRGFDTLLETTVLGVAGIAILALLTLRTPRRREARR